MAARFSLCVLLLLSGCFGGGDDDGTKPRADSGVIPPRTQDAGVAQDAAGVGTGFVPRPPCGETADCPSTDFCVTFGDEGLTSCVDRVMPPLACMPNAPQDCCVDADCNGGLCVSAIELAGACGGTAGGIQRNVCVKDACSSDAGCAADEVCAPDGRSEVRACIPAACHGHDDCTEHAGGQCELLDLECCPSDTGEGIERRPEVACVYPGIGCQRDSDCPTGRSCVVRDGRAECSDRCS